MRVAIRTDASMSIGTGHLMRCLTLADELRKTGAACTFVCREVPGNLIDLVRQRGHDVAPIRCELQKSEYCEKAMDAFAICACDASETAKYLTSLQSPPDWLIIDHYGIDATWENCVREYVNQVLVIDDMANRDHVCDVLLDQNTFENTNLRYSRLVPHTCCCLLGSEYVLLRPEFRSQSVRYDVGNQQKKLLIFLGGTDEHNYSLKIARIARELDQEIEITILVGATNRNLESLSEYRSVVGYNIRSNVINVAELMRGHTLAVSAAGFASYELACAGTPSILLALTLTQKNAMIQLARNRAAVLLDTMGALSTDKVRQAMKRLLEDADERRRMSVAGMKQFDGRGANRVAETMFEFTRRKCDVMNS